MQVLHVECTECGCEHKINDDRLWRVSDSIEAACPDCKGFTVNWITKIEEFETPKSAA